MEIKGDEFLKNVQIKQEEETLRQKIDQTQSVREQPNSNPYAQYNETNQDQELDDILLHNNSGNDNANNKKKYIILGISLVLLFVIILVLIKLLTNDESDAQFNEESKITQEKVLNDQKIQQEYQKILTDKLKKVNENSQLEESETIESTPPKQEEKTNENPLEMPVKKAVTIEEPQQEAPQKQVQETVKKEEVPVKKQTVPTPKVKDFTPKTPAKESYVAQGVFVQIGAFSKKPSDEFLKSISSKGYAYKMHAVNVNGKDLLKLLIGPYENRAEALKALDGIKKRLEAPNAYVLQL